MRDEMKGFYLGKLDLLPCRLRCLSQSHLNTSTAAHEIGFSVFTSRLLAMKLNTETVTSDHYEVFFSSVTLYSSVPISTQSSQFTVHAPFSSLYSQLLNPPGLSTN
jgi:hypothetical protein